ncbi:MAG: tetratricopeptide repeat protein [Thermodesulfobacteriota bacterium]
MTRRWTPVSLLALALFAAGCGITAGSQPAAPVALDMTGAVARPPLDSACAYYYFLAGKTAARERRLEEAREALDKALLCDPDSEALLAELVSLLLATNGQEEAVARLEETVQARPGSVPVRVLLARVYGATGRFQEAAAACREILARQPDNTEILLMLGTLSVRNRDYDGAKNALSRLVSLEPDSFPGHYYLARLHRDLREVDAALAAYDRAVALRPTPRLRLEAVELLEEAGRVDQALGRYRSLLAEAEEGDAEEIRGRIVNLLLREGRSDEALAELQALKAAASDRTRALFAIGRILLEQERFQEAVQELAPEADGQPGNGALQYLLALALQGAGDNPRARAMLERIGPDSEVREDARLRLAALEQAAGNAAAAEAVLRAEIARDGGATVQIFLALAGLLEDLRRNDDASAALLRGLELFPDDGRLIFAQGVLLDKQGDLEGALARMESLLELEPDNAFALNYVGYTWADRGLRLPEALAYIERAVALRPDDGFIRDSLGWVHFRLGNLEQASAELERAVALEPEDPTILEHLGDVCAEAGQLKRAAEAYEAAARLYQEDGKRAAAAGKAEAVRRRLSGRE